MKVSPIPNFGEFGAYVDGIDMDYMTDEQWTELGKLFIDKLVVVCRDIKITKAQYMDWIPKWGALKSNFRYHLTQKYGKHVDALNPDTWKDLDEDDRKWIASRKHYFEPIGDGRVLNRVYGGRDEKGNSLGYFSSGDVYWHSNESSILTFSPAVSLLGHEQMIGSATGFVQTVESYESLSESFRSELDEMVIVHRFQVGKINTREYEDEELILHLRQSFCPVDYSETPLICKAPNGRKGIRHTVNTAHIIKGMTQDESDRVFKELDKIVFDDRYIYDHFYQSDNDMCLFDNSVCLHRRLGGQEGRKAFRQQFDVSPLLDKPWLPWEHLPEYNKKYIEQVHDIVGITGGRLAETFKLPELEAA